MFVACGKLGDKKVKNWVSAKLAGYILLGSLGLLFVFHVLVLLGVVPADIVWGGMIQDTQTNLVTLEVIALLVTGLFMLVIAAKLGYMQVGKFSGIINIGVWFIFVFLLLNTLGNLASGVSLENLVFAPITIILAFCAFRLAIDR
jgi:hypothetical protein